MQIDLLSVTNREMLNNTKSLYTHTKLPSEQHLIGKQTNKQTKTDICWYRNKGKSKSRREMITGITTVC